MRLKLSDAKLTTFASRDLKRADLNFSKLRTPNASLIHKIRISSLKTQSSPCSRLKNLSQQARVSSINAKVAFAEHGRMDLKKEVSGRDEETKSLHGRR